MQKNNFPEHFKNWKPFKYLIDHIEMSKSDSEMNVRKHKPSSMQETYDSSSSKRRIQLNTSGRSGKRPPLEEPLPLTHTIP